MSIPQPLTPDQPADPMPMPRPDEPAPAPGDPAPGSPLAPPTPMDPQAQLEPSAMPARNPDRDAQDALVQTRAELTAEEKAAGSDDPEAQAAAILAESDERARDVERKASTVTPRRPSRAAMLAALAVLALALSACSDDTDAEAVVDRAGDAVDQTAARTQAEALRVLLKARAGDDPTRYRTVTLLNEAIRDLPGNTTVTGVVDTDGDGLDDDGRVQVTMNGESACLAVSGTNTTVTNGAC